MRKKWIAINLLLLSIAGLLGWQLNNSILRYSQKNDLSQIRPVKDPKQKITQGAVPHGLANIKIVSPAEFSSIPERNVFSETRSRDDRVDVPVVAEAPPLLQKPILVGVTISEAQKMASIIDPTASPQNQARSRRAQTKRIGDVYQGYTITEITGDHIVLEYGTHKEWIPLHEGSKRPQGGKTPILSTRVISFGGAGGASTGAPVVISGGAVTVSRGQGGAQIPTAVPVPTAAPGGSRGSTAQATAPGATAAQPMQQLLQQLQQGIQQGIQQMQQPPSRGNAPGNRGNNPIRTPSPFGDLTRPNQ